MKIRIKIGGGKVIHAAAYNPKTEEIKLNCDSLKYNNYRAVVREIIEPTIKNVSCRKCLKTLEKERKQNGANI